MTAAIAMLDTKHEKLSKDLTDSNTYVLGNIGPHNIVMTCLPWNKYGTNNAANVATNMTRTFRYIRLRFMVGIAGGVPRPDEIDLRLGDVMVGNRVIQYDIGKSVPGGRVQQTLSLMEPQQELSTAISVLQAHHGSEVSRSGKIPDTLQNMLRNNPGMTKYMQPDPSTDRLFCSSYKHESMAPDYSNCKTSMLVSRPLQTNHDPKIHYGFIASGNLVMKDGIRRDELAQELKVICFETEAASLMGSFPYLVVRGVCDYADSHKNDQWQEYAAAVATAYTKDLLSVISASSTESLGARESIKNAGPKGNSITGESLGGQRLAMGTDYKGNLDRLLPVDVMKSFGLDSSKEGRLKYAENHGIEGVPFTQD